MGSSASKTARKLPTTTRSTAWTGGRTLPPDPPLFERTDQLNQVQGKGKAREMDQPEGYGAANITGIGRDGKPNFSGNKDDTIKRDSMDPQFMSNLSKLGQVSIHDAGRFVPNPVAAQRTLNSRLEEYTNPNLTPPPNHLTAPLLSSLLDQLKTLPPGTDPSKLYEEYGMEKGRVEGLRRWVNSPSIKGDQEVVVVEGMEIVEMKALWVDSADALKAPPKALSEPK